jgi:hypothetical protein
MFGAVWGDVDQYRLLWTTNQPPAHPDDNTTPPITEEDLQTSV